MFNSNGRMLNSNINSDFYDIPGNYIHADKYKIYTS